MERICTEVMPAMVEIDGREYELAEKTVALAEELLAVQRKAIGKPEYVLWLAELEILLGKGAVKKLFSKGKKENLDRMQQIHAGVCRAFERNASEIERAQAGERAGALCEITEALEPVNELLRQLARWENADGKVIRRGEQ